MRLLGCAVLAGLLAPAAWAAPANDNFSAAQVLTGDYGTVTATTTQATTEPGEPSHAGVAPSHTVWYSFTATSDGPIEFDTFGSAIDTVVAVYTGTDVSTLDLIAANDDVCTDWPIQNMGETTPFSTWTGPGGVKLNTKRGTVYYIVVGSYLAGQGGAVSLNWAYTSSGVFRFSADVYSYSETVSDGSLHITTARSAIGARITVTRLFGTAGKVLVNWDTLDGTAFAGQDYLKPANRQLVFDNFEVNKSFTIPLLDDGLLIPGNPARPFGVCRPNPSFNVILTSATLDPSEDPAVLAPPRIDNLHSNATVNIIDIDGDIDPMTGNCLVTNDVVCFERRVFRTTETVGTVSIPVVPIRRDTTKTAEIHYVIDSTTAPGSNTRYNTFPLQAGSDYAAPNFDDGRLSLNVDFNLPYDYGSYGTLTWGIGDATAKMITIDIMNDGLPEFNEDINIQLFAMDASDLIPGNISSATLSVLYNDYPAGSLDVAHNPDLDITTDPPNNNKPGTDNIVYSILVQPDNKSIIAGNFAAFNGRPRYGIARLNLDGSTDNSFYPGDGVPVKDPINPAFITCMAFTPGGKILIGGNFPSYNGSPRYNVAQLNGDGSLDTMFNPGLGTDGTVWSLAVQTNGQVLIGGEFTTVNGYARSHIARLNPDGSLDQGFDPGTNGPNGTVNAIAVAADGSCYIGGDFSAVGGLSRRSVALLQTNGVVSTNFNPIVGADGPVFTMGLQPDGKLLIGGAFAIVELRSRNNIARYNPDGTLDLSFDPGTGADNAVYSITLQPDKRFFIGGIFNSVNQTHRVTLARLFPSGEVDTSFLDTAYNEFAGPHKPIYNPYVDPKDFLFATALQSDGKLMIGGSFHYVGGGRFTAAIQTNNVFPVDQLSGGVGQSGTCRASYRVRYNVARLLGGDTVGPGSIGFIATNYPVVENMSYLFVRTVRANGYLGQNEAVLSLPGRTAGPGIAKSGVDYVYQPTAARRGNPMYDSAWGNVVRAWSDCMYGTNNVAQDVFDHGWIDSLDDVYVTIINRAGFQGDRSLPLKYDSPSLADVFYLGGENIPLGTALARTSAMLNIQEDDTRPGVIGFNSSSFSVNENGTNAIINLVRTNGSVGSITVRFATTNGTAIAGVDYVGVTNTVTFRDGQTTTNVSVPIINDSVIQSADKTINLYLYAISSGPILGTLSNAVLYVVDDDFLPGHLNFSSTGYTSNELAGAMIFPVTRSGGNLGVLNIQYATSNLTAIAGVNYVPVSGSLHWDSGDTTTRYITVPILHDGLVTVDKQFQVALFNPSVPGSAGTRTLATATIVNTDAFGTLQFSAPSYNVSENGGYATVTVTRAGGSAETVSASFRTADSTAYQFFNYLPTNGSLVFGPGEVVKTLTVPVLDDGVQDPPNFGFNLILTNFSPVASAGYPINSFVNLVDAQSVTVPPGQLDTAFNPDAGFNNDVYSITLQPDGKIVAGGDFTTANGLPVNRLTRLLPDGSLDNGFLTPTLGGANDPVRVVLNQSDTRLVVGGEFTTFDNIVRNHLARLNYDGSIDPGFNPGSAADGPVYALAETFDTAGSRKLLAGGSFVTFNGFSRSGVVKLNDDGTVDTGFNTGIGVNGTVYAVAVYATNTFNAGKIVIAGEFTAVDGIARTRIARLNVDGSLDLTFDPGAGPNDTVRSIVLEPDGKVLLGGSFTNVNGLAAYRIARLNRNGSVDSTFQGGVGANDLVYTLALQPDNRIIVGGGFTRASGTTRNRLTRLMPDGAVDPTINFGTGANDFVASVAVQPDGKLVIAGGFTEVQGLPRAHLARLYGGSMTGSGSFRFSSAQYKVAETSTNILVTIVRNGGTSGPQPNGSGNVTVDFSTSDGTAVAGVNYSNVSRTLTFPPGETMETVVIPVIDDQQITPDLTVNLALANPTPPSVLGAQPVATLTIINDQGAISFSSATYLRPEDAIDGAATIEFSRIGSVRNSATVQFMTTTNGTAVPGVNYTPVTNTIVFQSGQSNQFIKIPIFHNPVAEGDKTVTLALVDPRGALLLAPYNATLTIQDVDVAPGGFTFSQTNYTVGEGDGFAVITVVRTNGRSGDVSVTATTLAGDATPGLKYIPTNYAIPFASGETIKSFTVPILDEGQVEGSQTLYLLLTNATGGTSIVGQNPVPLTILDNDVGVSFSTNASLNAVYITSETNTFLTIDVYRLNAPTNLITTISYATTNGSAIGDVDYIPISGSLTFNRGESHKSISVSLLRDPKVTGDLSFGVSLFNPSPGVQIAPPASANVVINDVDSGLSIFTTNTPPTNAVFTVVENGTNALITVIRTNANTGLVTVNYTTEDGTAIAPIDYLAASGILVFTNGQLSNSFTVPIVDNNLVDGDRSFNVRIFNPTAPAQLLTPTDGTVNIIDNDSGFRFSSGTYEVAENGVAALITVQRLGYTNSACSVAFSTQNGTAKAGTDYIATNGVLTFAKGEVTKRFTVNVLDNTIIDGDRTILLTLSNPTGFATLVNPTAATLTVHDNDGSLIIPAGSTLLSESFIPPDGVIQPGETVSLLFAFRNSAGSNTVNMMATLLPTNGVSAPSAPQTYGVLVAQGPSASREFSFTANGTNGQRIVVTFQLTDSGHPISTNSGIAVFTFTLGTTTASFTNSGLITINDHTTASPYPSVINVSGVDGVISKVTVGLNSVSHTAPSDIDALVVSPDNVPTLVMAHAGFAGISRVNLIFDDAAAGLLPTNGVIASGTYKPTAYLPVPSLPVPAPPAPIGGNYTSRLSTFNGQNPNGAWSLFVFDDTSLDAGAISNGWRVDFTLVTPVASAADVGLTMSGSPDPVVLGSNVTYTIGLVNYGPGAAAGVAVTNIFPAGALFVDAAPSVGTVSTNGAGLLAWEVGPMAKDSVASMTFTIQPTRSGIATNSAFVETSSADLNPDDDAAEVLTTVIAQSADLAMGLFSSPNPMILGQDLTYSLVVSNLGPGSATGVSVIDVLPPEATFLSASPSNYVLNGATLTFTNLGVVGNGGQILATIVVRPNVPGTLNNTASCVSPTTDPRKLNNSAAIKTVVNTLQLTVIRSGSNLTITWPVSDFTLETTTNLAPLTVWIPITEGIDMIGGQMSYTVPIGSGNQFFRLSPTGN